MAKKTPLQKALASKIGRTCHFTHPETGEVLQGVYRRGRKVVVLESLKHTGPGSYMLNERIYTVPKSIKITLGQAPSTVKP